MMQTDSGTVFDAAWRLSGKQFADPAKDNRKDQCKARAENCRGTRGDTSQYDLPERPRE